MFGQCDTLLHELNREDPRCYKNFLRVDADDVNRLKWSEGLGGPFCILAGDSFGDLLLLWRHYVASTLLFTRWQQVVVFSVVFECCMIIHELCTDIETVSGRTWPCIIRTGTVLVVWRSYKTVCTLVWIVRWSCDIRVLIRVLDVGNGFTRFHTIYIRYWHGWAHSWSGLHVRLYIRSRTVSHGLSRYCTIANTIIHGHGTRASFLKVLKIIHGFHGYTRIARV